MKTAAAFLSLITGTALALEPRIRIISTIDKAPNGALSVLNADAPDLSNLPFTSALSNVTSGMTLTNTANWSEIQALATTKNLTSEPFRNGAANCSAFIDDRLTVLDAQGGTAGRLSVEFAISGTFHVMDSIFTGNEFAKFIDGIGSMRVRMENDVGVGLTEIRVELAGDLLTAQGGATPRTVNGSFPFTATGRASVAIVTGAITDIRVSGGPGLSYSSDNYANGFVPQPDDDRNTFRPLEGIGTLACDFRGRLTRMEITGSGLTAPTIVSESGFNYNTLLTPPPPFQITSAVVNGAGTVLALTWNSGATPGSFRVRASPDLTAPSATWPIVQSNIPNAGVTTSFNVPISPSAIPRRFFVIERQ